MYQKWRGNEDLFRHIKAEKIHHQQLCPIRNIKGSPSHKGK